MRLLSRDESFIGENSDSVIGRPGAGLGPQHPE